MGERKGQNFYYPPDFDYKKHKSLNNYHGSHALRERAKKIDQGIIVIRFEMPFNIWCLGCHNHVGMGVRYNAEKKKVGMYYTTPLYEFRMKCHLCDNYYVIRTDPKNFDYELVEGCSRQEKRFDPSDIQQLGEVDRGFAQKLAADAMFKKEHEEEDKAKATNDESRIDRLEWIQERMRDDYAANSYLRAQFRGQKKSFNDQRIRDNNLRDKLSITATKLLPETDGDKRTASMITRYKDVKSYDEVQKSSRDKIESRRIFSSTLDSSPSTSSSTNSSIQLYAKPSDRLKATMKLERDKRINEQFCSSISPLVKKTKCINSDLGIRIKSKHEEKSDPAVCQKEEKQDEHRNINEEGNKNAFSLLADAYGSSDSE